MPYATFQDMSDKIGADTLRAKIKGSATLRQAEIEGYLLTATNKIDATARDAGYAVPLDETILTEDTDLQAGIVAWLRDKALTIAQYLFFQPLDTTDQIKAAQEWCKSELEELRAGTGLPVPPPAGVAAGALAWVPPSGASDRLTPCTFQRVRAVSP